MSHDQEMEQLRAAIANLDALRDIAGNPANRDWGISMDSLDETRHSLLARLGQLVLDGQAVKA